MTTNVRDRAALAVSLAGLAAVLALTLSWSHVLPGGWWLRGRVEPHAVREARERALHLAARCREFAAERGDDGRAEVVFLGSSTIERCDLARHFPGVRAVNRGVGGARGRELAEHVDALLAGTDPRTIVLYAGGPDRIATPRDVPAVLGAVRALAEAVRARAPRADVLLLGLLPTTTDTRGDLDALARIDAGIEGIAEELGFAHRTLRDTDLAGPDGRLWERLSTDGLHLRPEGYAILADAVRAAPAPLAAVFAR